MEKPIQAGMILKTKFVAAGNDKFTEYINYIDRDEAVRNDHFQKYDLFHDSTEQPQQDSWTEGYLTYMENPEKTTGLFTVGKDTLTQQDKQKLKELFTQAQKNNSVMWQTVFSFDNRWLQQNGLYNPLTRQVDARKLKEYTRAAMDKLAEKEALKGSAVWSAAIHYNTEHIHIHIAMVEPIPTRPIKIINGHEEYKGRFKQSSIDGAKSAAVNRILDQKQENQIINDLIRGKIIGGFREGFQAPPPDLTKGLRALCSHLPKDRRLWKYNMNAMKPLRPALDRLSKEFIEQYHKEDFQELIKRLNAQQEKYTLAYGKGGKSNQFTKQHLNDLYARMGNAILQELKTLDKMIKKAGTAQDLLPLPEGSGSAEAPETEPIFPGAEESLTTELSLEPEADSETSPLFSGEFRMEWNKGYKKARRLLYGTKKLKPDFKEALAALSLEANKGNVLAMDDLGKMFAYGMGREIDPDIANEWYSLALKGFLELYPENQMPYLAYRIGKHYHYGLGTEIDYIQAAKFFKIAADQGNQFAQYSLGKLFLDGKEDLAPNTQQAVKWLTLSADQGNQFAQYSLGKLYYYGKGPIAPNAEKAYLWLSRSAEQGNLFAKALLEKEAYQYQEVKRKVKENIGYLLSRLFKNLGNERDKRFNQMIYEHMEQQLQNELEQ